MKKSLLISFLLMASIMPFAPPPHIIVGPGEYTTPALNTVTGQVYDFTTGKATLLSSYPANVVNVIGGAHHALLYCANGDAYGWLDNSCGELGLGNTTGQGSPTKITTDSLGHPFGNVVFMNAGGTAFGLFWNSMAIKSDGTLWIWGNTQGGAEGNGTWGCAASTRPVQVQFPAGTFLTKCLSGYINVALDTAGAVWTWGGGGYNYWLGQGNSPTWMTPHKIPLPSRAVDIAGGSRFNYALLANGQKWAWGDLADYMGIYPTGNISTTVQNISSFIDPYLTGPLQKIVCNNESTYLLQTDGALYGLGGNAVGTMGIGTELNFATYKCCPPPNSGSPAPYAWDQGQHEFQQFNPVRIGPGLFFTDVFASNALCYTAWAEDANNQLYAWGRNKRSIANGVIDANPANGNLGSTYPNSWDVPWITRVNPFSVPAQIQVSCPYCVLNPSGFPCNIYAIPNVAGPLANAGAPQNIGISTGQLTGHTTSASNTAIIYNIWTLVSGPNTPIITLNSDSIAAVTGMITGTYTFKFRITDANWRVDSATTTITVGNIPPTVTAVASPSTIVQPANSSTLTGTVTPHNATIVGNPTWIQVVGPTTATITAPTALITTVTGLAIGTYIFQLNATDSNGLTGHGSTTVIVQPSLGCDCLNFNIPTAIPKQ
jgi:hypothetical protein